MLLKSRGRRWLIQGMKRLSSFSTKNEEVSRLYDMKTLAAYKHEAAVIADQEDSRYALRKGLRVPSSRRGMDIYQDPLYNKGTSFELAERDRLGLRGLLPPAILDMEHQIWKIMATLRRFEDEIAKHMYLADLHDRNTTLFHRVLVRHIEELAPIVYTPCVGKACQLYAAMYRRPRGMFFTLNDAGHCQAMVANYPSKDISIVVITDGSRILGIGDQGANSMPIPVGKLALYCAAGGIAPHRVLPVVVDVGTDNMTLRDHDPFYLGLKQPRASGKMYFDLIDEILKALYTRWPNVLVQFEDFNSQVAAPLLDRHRNFRLCFNDDIQGTGATVVAGILAALRQLDLPLTALADQRILVVGSGSAGIGTAIALREAAARGLDLKNNQPDKSTLSELRTRAAAKFYVVDKDGLIAKAGASQDEYDAFTLDQKSFAEDFDTPGLSRGLSLAELIPKVKPTIILGLTAVPGLFSPAILKLMNTYSPQRPIIFALSNPTSKAECTAAEAYACTQGRAIFASGSPFPAVEFNSKILTPSQCNNMFIFPGLGLGASLAKCTKISDSMLYAASTACAESISQDELDQGQVFASITRIRYVSKQVAIAVMKAAKSEGLARLEFEHNDLSDYVDSKMYYPHYVPLYQSPYDHY